MIFNVAVYVVKGDWNEILRYLTYAMMKVRLVFLELQPATNGHGETYQSMYIFISTHILNMVHVGIKHSMTLYPVIFKE